MRVYRTIEFTREDLVNIHKVQHLLYCIDKYDLRDEFEFCCWSSFTGDMNRLEQYANEHVVEVEVKK